MAAVRRPPSLYLLLVDSGEVDVAAIVPADTSNTSNEGTTMITAAEEGKILDNGLAVYIFVFDV